LPGGSNGRDRNKYLHCCDIEEVRTEMKIAKVAHIITIFFVMAFATMLYADDSLGKFTQQTLDGKIITSETLKGMPVVISFAATW
jgi:hypothetical protein